MVLCLPGRFETLNSLEFAARNIVSYGYAPEYYYQYASNVRRLSERDLNSAAASYIDPDRLTWLVTGDLAKVEASIRELDFGETVVMENPHVD